MSWFGDSLNSIKGQISNIAKEVLAEGADEVDDQDAQLKLANDKIRSLEASSTSYTAEIGRLEARNKELEDRLGTADLQLRSVSQQHRQELVQREREILSLRNQLHNAQDHHQHAGKLSFSEDDDGDDGDLDDLGAAQQKVRLLTSQLRTVTQQRHQLLGKTKDDHEETSDTATLQHRIQELERQLQDSLDRHQEQLSALQDSHQLQLQQLRDASQADGDATESTGNGTSPTSSHHDAAEHAAELQQLASQRDGLLAKLRKLSTERDVAATSLQEATAEKERLTAALKEATEEKGGLLTSLEELDLQNQAANEQVQRWRSEAATLTTAREQLQKSLADAESRVASLATEKDSLQQRLQQAEHTAQDLSSARDALQGELQTLQNAVEEGDAVQQRLLQDREEMVAALTAAKTQLERQLQDERVEGATVSNENAELLKRLQEKGSEVEDVAKLREKLLEIETGSATLAAAKDDAERMLEGSRTELVQLRTERDEMLQHLQSNITETDVLAKARDDLLQKLKEMKAEIQLLTENKNELIEKLQSSESELVSVQSHNERLQQESHQMAGQALEKESLTRILAEREGEVNSLTLSMAKLTKALEDQKLAAKTAEDASSAKAAGLQNQIEKLRGDLAVSSQTIEKVKQDLVRTQNSLSKAQDDKRVVDEHLEYYTTQVANETHEKLTALRSDNQALVDRCHYLEMISQKVNSEDPQEIMTKRDAPLAWSEALLTADVPVREEPEGQDTCNKEISGPTVQVLQSRLEAEQKRAEDETLRNSKLQQKLTELQSTNEELESKVRDVESKAVESESHSDHELANLMKEEEKQTAIRLLQILTHFNTEEIFASNSGTASLLDSLELAVQELQWRLQEASGELEEERGQLQQLRQRLHQLEQEQLLTAGSAEKLETISEDAERVAELEAEVAQLRAASSCEGTTTDVPEDVQQQENGLQQELADVRVELEESEQMVTDLEEQLAMAETAADREEQLRYEKEEQIIRVQTELTETAQKLETVRSELAAEVEKTHALAVETAKLEGIRQALEAVQVEKDVLRRQVHDEEKAKRDLEENHDILLVEKNKEFQEVEEQRRLLQQQCAFVESEKRGLRETIGKLESRIQELSIDIESEKSKNAQACSEISSLQQNQNAASALSEKCHELEAVIESLRATSVSVPDVCHAQTETSAEAAEDSANIQLTEQLAELSAEHDHLTSRLQALTAEQESWSAEKQQLSSQLSEVTDKHTLLTSEHHQLTTNYQHLTTEHEQLTIQHHQLAEERQQLIAALNQKHAESLQYHGEIQRLQAQQGEDQHQLSEARAQLQLTASELAQTRRARDEAVAQAQQLRQSQDQLLIKLQERNKTVTELQSQTSQLEESERRLQTELRRLRDHLVVIEENYTQEAINAEQREHALREKLASELQSSADSEINSQRMESLQEQLTAVSQQRDDVTLQLDDVTNSLTNLQHVLEQFQREKQREVAHASSAAQRENRQLRQTIESLKVQLQEASDGLSAANRLNEQLDRKQDLITALKADVEAKVGANVRLAKELEELKNNTSGKVDKSLVKNLVVGYVSAPAGHEREVLRLIATVLDFSREERIKARLDPTPVAAGPAAASLTQEFVRFLEAESTPRRPATLPAEKMAEETTRRVESRLQRAQTPLTPLPGLLRTTPPPSVEGHSRQSSASSSNLLLDVQEAASSSSVLRAIMDGSSVGGESAPSPSPSPGGPG